MADRKNKLGLSVAIQLNHDIPLRAVIIREICSRHVESGPCEHVVCAASQKRLLGAMYHASAFRPRVCNRSHVCVFARPRLNVGELPRFYNQLRHLATLSLHIVDLACDELLEFADIGRELANTFLAHAWQRAIHRN